MSLITNEQLFGLKKQFLYFVNLYNKNKLPKILMLSGKKGIGKFTLINHFLYNIFLKKEYDLNNNLILDNNFFYSKYKESTFPNIIYLSGAEFKNIKIDDIRNLKSILSKSTISDSDRFVILDDVELFNKNSLNALLKIIEEPTNKNYFILINNKTRPVLETIISRSLEFKISISNKKRIEIIENLIKIKKLNIKIDYTKIFVTPGNFLVFNEICEKQNINIEDDLLKNIEKLILIYKKNKNIDYINLLLSIVDFYYFNLIKAEEFDIKRTLSKRDFVLKNINNFVYFNINSNSLINSLNHNV